MTVAPANWAPTPNELQEKTILVTGATGGIGRAVSVATAASPGADAAPRAQRGSTGVAL